MVHEYKKPRLNVKNWNVTKKDLRILYNFFCKYFKKIEIEIHIDAEGNESRIYNDFKKFEKALGRLIDKNIRIDSILFSAGHTLSDGIECRKYIWILLNFKTDESEFYLYAKDTDGSLMGWADSAYKKLTDLVSLFENRRDLNSKIQLSDMVDSDYKSISGLSFTKGRGWYEYPIRLLSIFVVSSWVVASIISLIIQIIVNWGKSFG